MLEKLNHESRVAICIKKASENCLDGPKFGWRRASGNLQGEANSVSGLVKSQIWNSPACSVGEGLTKGMMASASTLSGRRLIPKLLP